MPDFLTQQTRTSMASITMRLPLLFAILTTLTKCHSTRLSVIEGEKANFEFPYPCDSARVTLRRGDESPFYDAANTEPISLSSERLHRFNIQDIIKTGHCSLHLTINPVKNLDGGTYISFTYSRDGTLSVMNRLNVDTLPGKVSCTLNEYEVENWVELQCVAPTGSLPGEIQCYQNGERMPPLTEPVENTEHLRGTVLVKNTNPVFCCTAAWIVPKDICECKDFYLRFDDDLPVTGEDAAFIDPCATMTTSSVVALTNKDGSKITKTTRKDISEINLVPGTEEPQNYYRTVMKLSSAVAILVTIVVLVILIVGGALYLYKRQSRKRQNVYYTPAAVSPSTNGPTTTVLNINVNNADGCSIEIDGETAHFREDSEFNT